jgi:F420-0:gamma-glutamyl ligase
VRQHRRLAGGEVLFVRHSAIIVATRSGMRKRAAGRDRSSCDDGRIGARRLTPVGIYTD